MSAGDRKSRAALLERELRAQAADHYERPSPAMRDRTMASLSLEDLQSDAPAPVFRIGRVAPLAAAALLAVAVGLTAALWTPGESTAPADPQRQAAAWRDAVSLLESERWAAWRERSMQAIRDTATQVPIEQEARALLSDSRRLAQSMFERVRVPNLRGGASPGQ